MNATAGKPVRATYLGFDFGQRRIGIAVGERDPVASFPLTTLSARAGVPDWQAIAKLINNWHPGALVVGIPMHMDGSGQAVTRAARRFAHQLKQRFELPVHEADERLSSRSARELHRAQRAAGKRMRKSAGDEDRIAASLILKDWLLNQADLDKMT
ncbi:MAG: Holliday junction resolvase RuvX [Gammaproteobacteria bacterium]|nr:Holliday junction resolvase RuvX [Gammaproteobacteria bacterium]